MEIDLLIRPEVQDFIFQHEYADERGLVLKHKEILGAPASWIADQIRGRKKAKTKLPAYYQTKGIIYPPGLNLEQSSSEKTAQYKSEVLSLVNEDNSLADVTGGFGIDTLSFSKVFKSVYYNEPNESLVHIAKHNHHLLGSENISYFTGLAEEFLSTIKQSVDVVYIDPSRRSASGKVFKLSDCQPDVVSLQDEIFSHAKKLAVKVSPLLDLQQGIRKLKNVSSIHVIAVANECKELLFVCDHDFNAEPKITTVNLSDKGMDEFSFLLSDEKVCESTFSDPREYLYEPNAAILKGGAFKLIGKEFSLSKLHPDTHLYTSHECRVDFPGRIFRIEHFSKPDAKEIRQQINRHYANVITRNYPLPADGLRKKLKLRDGGENYVIAFSGKKEKFVVIASRIK